MGFPSVSAPFIRGIDAGAAWSPPLTGSKANRELR